MKHFASIVTLLSILGGFACRDSDEPCLTCPPPYNQSIFLDTTYVETTEIGLHVQMTDSLGTSAVQLFRDTTVIFSQHVLATDTTIIDTSLLPARLYQYKAYRLTNGQRVDSSNALTTRTMDTTSHNFTWEIDTLGDGNSSVLYDVAIVNDTLAYAVGEINVRDSLGNWVNPPYNIAKWNGQRWEYMRRLFDCRLYYPNCGPGYFLYAPASSIFAFGTNDIWIAAGTAQHFDGTQWTEYAGIEGVGLANKIWGTSSNDLYFVGYGGFIVHKFGSTWQQMESGTDVTLLDVWGSLDGSMVWVCGWKDLKPTVFLRLQNNVWGKIWEENNPITLREDSLSGILTSVWTPNNRKLLVASHNGVYSTHGNTQGEARRLPLPQTWPSVLVRRLRGNAFNDWTIVGTYYSIAHFNGYTWQHYEQLMSSDGRLYSVDQKGNLIFAVGEFYDPINSRGIVIRGKR